MFSIRKIFSVILCELVPYQNCCNNLHYQYCRHAHHKIPVLCLMPEQVHTRPCPDAAAEQTCKKQRPLRYSPCMSFGFALIQSHQKKTYHIHQYQINDRGISHFSYSRFFSSKLTLSIFLFLYWIQSRKMSSHFKRGTGSLPVPLPFLFAQIILFTS